MSRGQNWWIGGKTGSLPPVEQAKVWALDTLQQKFGVDLSNSEIAALVYKVPAEGGELQHPTKQAIVGLRQLFARDPAWYPGKTTEEARKRGPKPQFTSHKRRCVAQAAMSLKASGLEPSVSGVVQRCPEAAVNPRTQAPFTDKYILQVFRTHCHDGDLGDTWGRMEPLHKTALTGPQKIARIAWARRLLQMGRPAGWYRQNCVWIDPCSTIVYASPKAAFDEQRSSAGKGKRWMSKSSRQSSRNLRASAFAGKQVRAGDTRLWWFVIVARGRVEIEFMGDYWKQAGAGMAEFMTRLPAILRRMLGPSAALPRVVVSDRGPGFYLSGLRNGEIVPAYAAALRHAGFRPFAGSSAAGQPADCPDLLLHETAVGWIRKYFKRHPFHRSQGLAHNIARVKTGMSSCVEHINGHYAVEDLCSSWPRRLEELVLANGERLKY